MFPRTAFGLRVLLTAVILPLLGGISSMSRGEETPDSAEKILLRYRFETGDVLRYQVEQNIAMRTTIEETTEEIKGRTESVKAWKVLDVLPDEEIEFSHVVDWIKMRNEQSNRPAVSYDSRSDETAPPLYASAAQSVGVVLSIHRITPAGEILDRQQKHGKEAFKDDIPITIPLPTEPVAVGATWTEPHKVSARNTKGEVQRVDTRRKFELESVKNGVATISSKFQVLTPIDAAIEYQLAQRLFEGKIRFDIEKGRILSQEFDVDRRIVGFAGPASRVHLRTRFREKLLTEEDAQTLAARQAKKD